jgi:hypothetical protein
MLLVSKNVENIMETIISGYAPKEKAIVAEMSWSERRCREEDLNLKNNLL